MPAQKSALFLVISSLLGAHFLYAKCDFSDQKEPIKTYCNAFKKSEKLILGEKVKASSNKAEELIYRSKTKDWKSFDWKLRPLELFAVIASQEKYLERCESKQDSIFNILSDDLTNEKIPSEARKKAVSNLILAFPCLDVHQLGRLEELSTEYFLKNTEDFLNMLIGVESEAPRYNPDYKSCSGAPIRKFAITDFTVKGIEKSLRKTPMQKSLFLRLKRLRSEKMHYKTAEYFFGKIDNLIINKN
jgi:hypothetical protein